jgi:hypothetical protein
MMTDYGSTAWAFRPAAIYTGYERESTPNEPPARTAPPGNPEAGGFVMIFNACR